MGPIFQHNFTIPFGQTWSLGIEEKFYLVWPLVAFWWLARSQHRIQVTLALLVIMSVLTATGGVLSQMWGSYTDILIGCLLGLLLHDRKTYDCLAVLGRTGIAWAILAALGLATLSPITGTQLGERLFSLLAATAIAALVTNTSAPAAVASAHWSGLTASSTIGVRQVNCVGPRTDSHQWITGLPSMILGLISIRS
jgi:peptidoglycan/LPS O-acetylase OafA/YrhL